MENEKNRRSVRELIGMLERTCQQHPHGLDAFVWFTEDSYDETQDWHWHGCTVRIDEEGDLCIVNRSRD